MDPTDTFASLFDAMINWPNGTATEDEFREALRGVLADIDDECERYSMGRAARRVVLEEVKRWADE